MAPPVSGLCALPEELLLAIMDFFYDQVDTIHEDQTVLCSLCLTNRRLYGVAQPLLYRKFKAELCNNRQLLGILLKEPRIGPQIRELSFQDSKEYKSDPLTYNVRRHLCKKMEEFGITNPYHYFPILEVKKPKYILASDEVLAAMLLLTPGIQTLAIYDSKDPTPHSLAWMRMLGEVGFHRSLPLADHFQHLHSITIDMRRIPFTSIINLIGIPSIRSLRVMFATHENDVPEPFWDLGISPHSSPLKNLYLDFAPFVDSRAVAWVLHYIKALQVFRYVAENGRTTHNENLKLNYPVLIKGLLEHKDFLEECAIINRSDTRCKSSAIGSLQHFYRLHTLSIDIECFSLMGETLERACIADKLPGSLTGLQIVFGEADEFPDAGTEQIDVIDEEDWKECLEDLGEACRTRLPRLKKIVFRKYGSNCAARLRGELAELFSSNGVEVVEGSTWS
ncbi:hypothetical protein P280DRAFT_466748 [Massarina eburnea CBS 473.64]|uniref:Uncharacterized protein n=1 Tax=Massarina eburnea CBS 473.64 TaxID=1395130 RepID=A0A6A6SA13_9PLEO|nr:hypothetical protein P280DRAFT_466748 [Massarina eburnea CBS 473.64]